jgi:hypothetical protein
MNGDYGRMRRFVYCKEVHPFAGIPIATSSPEREFRGVSFQLAMDHGWKRTKFLSGQPNF